MKVLIADDEINIILLIKSLIDRQKTDVEIAGEAGDGITALEMVRQLKPDVVITDIRMPGMNGMDLIRHVRDVLAKLESQRASRREQQMQFNLMEDRLASNNGILRKNLLQNLLTGDGELFRQALGTGKVKDIFDYRGSFFTVAAVKLDCVSDSEYQVPEQAVETITAKIMRKLKACCHETEFIISRSWGYICLNYDGGEPALDHICSELGDGGNRQPGFIPGTSAGFPGNGR